MEQDNLTKGIVPNQVPEVEKVEKIEKEVQDIGMLEGAAKLRLRPGVMLGSDGIEGVQQTLFEIITNSIDRHKAGYGDTIVITRHADFSFTIEDFADGLPMGWNEKTNAYNWELTLRRLYAGGNYNTGIDDHNGQLGLNGLGLTSTQQTSEWMIVTSYKEMYQYTAKFKQGRPVDKETGEFLCDDTDLLFSKELGERVLDIKENTSGRTGTVITYKPDKEVFADINVSIDWINEKTKKQAIVNKGLKIIINDEITGQSFDSTDSEIEAEETKKPTIVTNVHQYENGIIDYINEVSQDPLNATYSFEGESIGRDAEDKPDYKVRYEFAFNFSRSSSMVECYHNSSELEHGGSTLEAIKLGMVAALHKYLSDEGLYNKNESKIKYDDVRDSLVCVINSYSSKTSYSNQTKKAISNKFIKDFVADEIKKHMEVYFLENATEAKTIGAQILVNKRSREKAEKTRLNVRKQLSEKVDIFNRVKKFVDCREKNASRRELYIVEGDSALGSCKLGRDATFQALMPVRGKILNCLKADYDKIFKSEIIVDLLKIFGCGIEVKSKHNKDLNTFDLSKLKYGKIIICTDADEDGMQIRTLILTMIYILCPTLITEGRVFIVESPLFEITIGAGKNERTVFAYSEADRDSIVNKTKGKCSIQRSKGLGENTPDMMWETTMNPETRKLIKINMNDAKKANDTFELFLGDKVEPRRDFITENGYKYIDETEAV